MAPPHRRRLMLMTALLAATLAAPVPKLKPVPYFPTIVGTKRVMTDATGFDRRDETQVVTKVEVENETFMVTAELETHDRALWTEVFEVTAKKVRQVESKVLDDWSAYDRTLFDLGVKAGETQTRTWENKGAPKSVHTFTQGEEEEVKVPAGKFTAIPVIETLSSVDLKNTSWYAAGVGLVKEEREWHGAKTVKVLKEFTLGKDAKK